MPYLPVVVRSSDAGVEGWSATGLVDLQAKVVIDMVEGNRAVDLRRWTAKADPGWLGGMEVVAIDLGESFAAGLSPHLNHARRVADPFQ